MHYTRNGKGEPLFLLHGFASSSLFWQTLAAQLGEHFDVISIDWPGFGASAEDKPYESLKEFADGLLGLANELDIQKFHVMGHSMSGFVVQQLLHKHADSLLSAVLYGAGLKLDKSRRFETIEETLEKLKTEGVEASAERIIKNWFADAEAHPMDFQLCLEAANGMSIAAGQAAIKAMENADFTQSLAAAKTPTLIILGEDERTHPPHSALEMRAALPNAHLSILPFAGHAAHLEQPLLFHSTVQQFLLR